MVNKNEKGSRLERIVANYLKSLKEVIVFRSVRVKYQNVDFANAFDIVSVIPNEGFRFVQVKTHVNPFIVLKNILKGCQYLVFDGNRYEVWSYKDKNVFKVCSFDKQNGFRVFEVNLVLGDEKDKC